MSRTFMVEAFGYLGSFLVVVAMLMTSVKKLRIINSIGAGIFAIYALIIHSYPTALMNTGLVIINIYNLALMAKKECPYKMVKVDMENSVLKYFLKHYEGDIKKYFPEMSERIKDSDRADMIYTDATLAGISLGRMTGEKTMELILDYSTPAYRDFSVGTYVYSQLQKDGICRLEYKGTEEKHITYLKKMGFQCENKIWVKNL